MRNKTTIYWLAGVVIVAALIYLIVIRLIPSSTPQDSMVAVQCTGKTVYRYKNAEDIFPVITKDYSTNLQIASGVLNKLVSDSGTSTVSLGVKNSAQSLIETLNQDNIFFQNTLKAYFLASNNDPCNDSLRYLYTAFIKDMTEKEIELKQFVSQITTPPVQSPGTDTVSGKVLAVVDTSSGKIDTTVKNKPTMQPAAPEKMVVLDNKKILNTAVTNLANRYTTQARFKRVHR